MCKGKRWEPGMVIHACNLSYSRGEDLDDHDLAESETLPISTNKKVPITPASKEA
jgi:hypothetical protein